MEKTVWGYLVPHYAKQPAHDVAVETLKSTVVTLGRDSSSDIVLQGSQIGCRHENISKNHFQLQWGPNGILLKDESRLGTYINTKLVGRGKHMPLPNCATISIIHATTKVFKFVNKAASDASSHPKNLKDNYAVAHVLGKGGFGDVFLVLNKSSLKQYAMKIVKNSLLAKREIEILQELKHPCTIRMYSIFRSTTQLYLILEYMQGGDLSRWVNDKKILSEAQTKLIFYQLALAVQYLHEQNICHRDLKPANILMESSTPHTLIKVTDFGLAKDEDIHSNMTTCAGTEVYLAPEVMTSQTYTKKVDVWSMGVILFYCLCGMLPFHSMSEALKVHYHIMLSPVKWRGVSMSAMNLVQEMLVVVPDRRIGINALLATPWFKDESMKADVKSLMEKNSLPKAALPTNRQILSSKPGNRQVVSPRGVLQYLAPKDQPLYERRMQPSPQLEPGNKQKSPQQTAATPPRPRLSPLRIPGAPLRTPGAPLRIPGAPLRIADAPLRIADAPLRIADAPLRIPGAPLRIPLVHKAHDSALIEARNRLKPVWKP